MIITGHDRVNVTERGSRRSHTRSLDLEARAPLIEPGRGLAAGGDLPVRDQEKPNGQRSE